MALAQQSCKLHANDRGELDLLQARVIDAV
jgi:hypothetical protein